MEKLKKILSYFDQKALKRYGIFSVLVIFLLLLIISSNLTQARYENTTSVRVTPTLAFFVVGVESQTGQIKLSSMVPRNEPYLYSFNVSNFNQTKKANVDLTYSIEIITTTNMPLNYRIFVGNDMTNNAIDADTFDTDENGVYYRHLVINNVNTLNYNTRQTDVYTLWVEFPEVNKNYPIEYAGIIDLVDIKINAEQVV